MKCASFSSPLILFGTLLASLVGCGDVPGSSSQVDDELPWAASPDEGETGDAGFGSTNDAGGADGGCGDSGALDPKEQLEPGTSSGGEDVGESARPAGGVCLDGEEVIAACLESDPLMFDCNASLIESCESAGFVFVEMEPDEVPVDWDCDDFNDWLHDCTGGWLAACAQIGGSIDCHHWIGDTCVEATCEAPTPG